MLRLLLLSLLVCLLPGGATALVSEGRPGVPYFGHVLFLQQKIVEDGRVVAVSLAYADPRDDKIELCSNTIDVFGGLELFRDIEERNWVLVDYELQSILIADGFTGDADVFRVSACGDAASCLARSEQLKADPLTRQAETERPRAEATIRVNFENIQQRLEIGRKLVKAARCRGCHSLEGFGPDYAPSLTWKRFKYEPGWLEEFLRAPYRMRPGMGELMMLNYTSPNAKPSLRPEELQLVADYLTSVATASAPSEQFRRELWRGYDCYACHTSAYRARPLAFRPTSVPADIRERVAASAAFQSCLGCHPFGDLRTAAPAPAGTPNAFASDLLLAFEKLSLNYLAAFLANPSYFEPETRMPDPGLDAGDIEEIRALARQVKEAIAAGRLSPVHVVYQMEKRDGAHDPAVPPEGPGTDR